MSAPPSPPVAAGPFAVAVDTGPACNNRCAACARAPAPSSRALALPPGAGPIVVHGGEPTLHPDLADLLRRAGDAGRPVTLDTNARAFAVPGRAAMLRQAGLAQAIVTLLGGREASHDFLTRTPGSFRQTVAGAMQLRAAGVRLVARLVVSRSVLPELTQMATVALGLGAQAIRFAWARMEPHAGMVDLAAQSAVPRPDAKGVLRVDPNTPAGDRAGYDQGREWLVPRFTAASEPLAAAVRAIQKLGKPVTVEGVPLCLAPAGAAAAPSAPTCALPAPPEDAFVPACDGCAERARCPGMPRGYLARFGAGELVPFPAPTATT